MKVIHLVYGLTQFPYTYIAEKYPKQIQFDSSQMRIVTIDIEVECENGFPNADQALDSMSLSQSKTMTRTHQGLGLHDYHNDRKMFNTSSVRQNVNFVSSLHGGKVITRCNHWLEHRVL